MEGISWGTVPVLPAWVCTYFCRGLCALFGVTVGWWLGQPCPTPSLVPPDYIPHQSHCCWHWECSDLRVRASVHPLPGATPGLGGRFLMAGFGPGPAATFSTGLERGTGFQEAPGLVQLLRGLEEKALGRVSMGPAEGLHHPWPHTADLGGSGNAAWSEHPVSPFGTPRTHI